MSNEIINYNIAGGKDLTSLVAEVREQINSEGAQPLGGICTFERKTENGVERHFIQALVIYKNPIAMLN